MITKILIANRGEIACRLMRTCQRMGIRTVAVYSEPDANLPHVEQADEAYLIGPAPSRDSYLNIENILAVAKKTGAQAIHPGYGFLSEKAEFAKAVEDAGLIFIGPSSSVIKLMGDKIEAKTLAKNAGVHLVPGTSSPLVSVQEAIKFCNQHPGPILLKAAAGGGGKGMRIVDSINDLPSAFERVQSEAQSAFGDPRIFIERYIESPHHVEIQILGDQFGHIIHLGERDCSLQRRHQKVIEETPSPFIPPDLREEMIAQALKLAKASHYYSAGTVEFIVSPQGEFYFLEMNTRLQVEHPITEALYGIDLVEWMIRIAAGEKLTLQQSDLIPRGHAIEARLYAEDANQDFLPNGGRLIQFHRPDSDEIRFETGYDEGDEISIYYDPMMAKIITHTVCDQPKMDLASKKKMERTKSLQTLSNYISSLVIDGVISNQNFLVRLLNHSGVKRGEYHTHFIQDHILDLTNSDEALEKLSLTTFSQSTQDLFVMTAAFIENSLHPSCKQSPEHPIEYCCVSGNKPYYVSLQGNHILCGLREDNSKREKQRTYNDVSFGWTYQHQTFELSIDQQKTIGRCEQRVSDYIITIEGISLPLAIVKPATWDLLTHLPKKKNKKDIKTIKAPMPGTLLQISMDVGQKIKKGQPLIIIEAMKMENILKSPTEGIIAEIYVKAGENLMRDQIIARFE